MADGIPELGAFAISISSSKVTQDCIGFALLRSVIGLEDSSHSLYQSDSKFLIILFVAVVFT